MNKIINKKLNTKIITITAIAFFTASLSACTSVDNNQENTINSDSEFLQAYNKQKQQQISQTTDEKNTHNLSKKGEQKMQDYITTDSGLQYKVIREGTGKSPTASDTVTVHYEGKLTNGQIFDSSYQRNEPTTFPLNRVIAGWTEGLQLAKEGGKYEFHIPAELAYGSRGAGRDIPPNSALIFIVELIKVK